MVQLLDCRSLEESRRFEAHDTDWVKALAFSTDGRVLATGSGDHNVRLWDVATCERLATLDGHLSGVTDVCFSPDGKLIASCGDDRTVRIWDAASYSLLCTLSGHDGYVHCIAFSHDGKMLVSGAGDTTVLVWDVDAAVASGRTETRD